MSILDRIRANGGDVILRQWRITIRRGRLDDKAMAWIRSRRTALMSEVFPEFHDFEERAAIREYDGGQDRATAETEAYREVVAC